MGCGCCIVCTFLFKFQLRLVVFFHSLVCTMHTMYTAPATSATAAVSNNSNNSNQQQNDRMNHFAKMKLNCINFVGVLATLYNVSIHRYKLNRKKIKRQFPRLFMLSLNQQCLQSHLFGSLSMCLYVLNWKQRWHARTHPQYVRTSVKWCIASGMKEKQGQKTHWKIVLNRFW